MLYFKKDHLKNTNPLNYQLHFLPDIYNVDTFLHRYSKISTYTYMSYGHNLNFSPPKIYSSDIVYISLPSQKT